MKRIESEPMVTEISRYFLLAVAISWFSSKMNYISYRRAQDEIAISDESD